VQLDPGELGRGSGPVSGAEHHVGPPAVRADRHEAHAAATDRLERANESAGRFGVRRTGHSPQAAGGADDGAVRPGRGGDERPTGSDRRCRDQDRATEPDPPADRRAGRKIDRPGRPDGVPPRRWREPPGPVGSDEVVVSPLAPYGPDGSSEDQQAAEKD